MASFTALRKRYTGGLGENSKTFLSANQKIVLAAKVPMDILIRIISALKKRFTGDEMLERLALRLLAATCFVVCALSLACSTAPPNNPKTAESRSNPAPADAKPSSTVQATNVKPSAPVEPSNVKASFQVESTNVKSNSHAESTNNKPSSNAESTNVKPNIQRPAPASYEGYLDAADCKSIWGWVWNQKQKPNEVVQVDIWDGGGLIGTVRADQPRWSVTQITGDKGNHGFVYAVPTALRDGKAHVIRVKVARTNFELQGSPKTIKCKGRVEGGMAWARLY